MMVYVQNIEGNPIDPTERCGRVGYLLRKGLAHVVMMEPFTIRLHYTTENHVQAVTLGVDSGDKHIGLCASTEKKVLYSAQVELRTDVSKLLTARREFRRARRGRKHNWYRPARWQNRANEKGNAALPPSIRHKADSHIRAIRFMCKMLPIAKICLEIGRFDSQKIANPEIQGKQYQQGTLTGWENLKAFAKYRDGYKCRICGKSKHKDGVKLEVHHIIRQTDGGTDTPDNVVTLCHDCHEGHHQGVKILKLKRPPLHKGEAHMNAMRNYLVKEVKKQFDGVAIEVTYGYLTKIARKEHIVEKNHTNDAFCIAGNFEATQNYHNIYHHYFIRRHRRNLHTSSIKSPIKLSASVQKQLSEKMRVNGFRASKKMTKKVKGFALYDIVTYKKVKWAITSLRSNCSFNLTRFSDGATELVGYKWLSNRCAAKGWVTERLER